MSLLKRNQNLSLASLHHGVSNTDLASVSNLKKRRQQNARSALGAARAASRRNVIARSEFKQELANNQQSSVVAHSLRNSKQSLKQPTKHNRSTFLAKIANKNG